MSGGSSNVVAWSTLLEPAKLPEDAVRRADDPRLGEIIEQWQGDSAALVPGRAVLIGFPQDEGVRRNHGRPGAAAAPNAIRQALSRLTPHDGSRGIDLTKRPLVDLGNVRIVGNLEESQQALADVVAGVLNAGAFPIVLGGGHEMAYGHYLGYVRANKPVGIINIDAHLDVRPTINGLGHSGSPFRQALEHPTQPLPGDRYVCLGAQPSAVSREHLRYVQERSGMVRWADEVRGNLAQRLSREVERLAALGCHIYVTIDADVVHASDVPGVSAPNPAGLSGIEVIDCAFLAGSCQQLASFDLVEINPMHDRDGQSVRWAALLVWNFLCGFNQRPPLAA